MMQFFLAMFILLTCFSCTNQTRLIQPIPPRMICEVGFENDYDEANKKYKENVFFVQKSFVITNQSVYVHVKMKASDHWYKIELSSKTFNHLYHSEHFKKVKYSTLKHLRLDSEGCIFGPFPIAFKVYKDQNYWNASYSRLESDFDELFHQCSKAIEISENAVPHSVLHWEKRIVHSTEQKLNTEQRKEVTKSKTVIFSE